MDEEMIRQVAAQLRHPRGEAGLKTAEMMEKGNAFITARSREILDLRAGESVVELGPANGALSVGIVERLGPQGRYLGIENSPEMARLAHETLSKSGACSVEVRVGSCLDVAVADESCDAIVAVNLIYFVADLQGLCARLHTWLRPGGRVVFGVRSEPCMREIPFTQHGFHLRSADEVMRQLSRAGFVRVGGTFFDEGTSEFGELKVRLDSVIISAHKASA